MTLSVGAGFLLLLTSATATPPVSPPPATHSPPRIVARWPTAHDPGPAPMLTPPVRPPPPQTGLQLPGNYLYLSPGLGGLVPIPDVGAGAYAWGLGAGHHFTRGRRFAADVGGYFDHLVVIYLPGEDGSGTSIEHNLRMGPELRIGARSPRVFAYGLARVGLELLIHSNFFTASNQTRPVSPWISGMVGGGVQGLVGRRFLIGGEGGLDYGAATFIMFRLRLMLGVRF